MRDIRNGFSGSEVELVQARRAWVEGRWFADTLVETEGGVIAAVHVGMQQRVPGALLVDTLLPGLINAHCHLEYSHLEGQLPAGGVPFGEWMSAIIAARGASRGFVEEGMRRGVRELLRGGCTFVIDSSTDGASRAILEEAGISHLLLLEVLGLTEERGQEKWSAAMGQLKHLLPGTAGINPHAPYSVGPWLRAQLRTVDPGVPVAWHLGETPDEEELFRAGTGSIAESLKRWNLPMPWAGAEPPRCSAIKFLRHEKLVESANLIFHANTLTTDDVQGLRKDQAIVHCPGAHRYFARPKFPLRQMLDVGASVCLGTDSLASSGTLSMLEVMRVVAVDHPEVSEDEILAMATSSAGSLPLVRGAGAERGRISVGCAADFCLLNGDWQTGTVAGVVMAGKHAKVDMPPSA